MARVTGIVQHGTDGMLFMRLEEHEVTFHCYLDFHPNAPGRLPS